MSKAVFTITDNPNGTINVDVCFEPIVEGAKTPAQQTALRLLAIMKRDATSMSDMEIHHRAGVTKFGGKLKSHSSN